LILDLMVTEGNKQKRARPFLTLPLSSLHTPLHKVGVGFHTHRVIEVVNPDPYTLHPRRVHRPIVEAVLSHDSEAAFSATKKTPPNLVKL
jgi:hypothetical protein